MDVREKASSKKRLIDANRAMEIVRNQGIAHPNAYHLTNYATLILREAPTVDAVEVVHGRWIDGDPYCPICRKDKFRGLDADVWSDWKPDYCPNCGAKMDGELNK